MYINEKATMIMLFMINHCIVGALMPRVTGVMDNRMTEGLTQLRSVFLL